MGRSPVQGALQIVCKFNSFQINSEMGTGQRDYNSSNEKEKCLRETSVLFWIWTPVHNHCIADFKVTVLHFKFNKSLN
jgi:hypothetical protein